MRQVDVLIGARWEDGAARRIIVDGKRFASRIDIKDVESFEGMMRDCDAQFGIMVCPHGYTEGAKRRAQDAITIKILSLDEAEELENLTPFEECVGACAKRRGKMRYPGVFFWEYGVPLVRDGLYVLYATGKCDVCHNFNVWCWDCGERFALSDEDDVKCGCERSWFTVIEEEVSDHSGQTLNAVHLLFWTDGGWFPIDRRPLR